ncbi:Uncharacterised protein [Stenotrophomonas maltophilia]|nr:Uncharacterised protein [Stenotrophomonas maltophilia]
MARLYRKQIPRADQSAPCVDAFRSANQGWHHQGPKPQNPGHHAPDSSGLTRNHAAYSAGRNTRVSTVPTIRPPMIEIAIEP